jgi:ribosomal protein S18 acetylase RimI-like enzyme
VNIVIRVAIAQDYDDLCALFDEGDELHRDNLPQRFHEPTGPVRDKEYILGLIANENVGLFAAETEGQLVGFAHVVIRDSPPISIFVPRRYAYVENLVVKEGFRRAGIGRALMSEAHDWAIARGASSVELNVYEFNVPAIAFYQELGYQTISRQMNTPLR